MSDSPNLALIRRLYESRMAPEVTAEIMAPDLVWDITPGFPNSGVYHGWDSVPNDFFGTPHAELRVLRRHGRGVLRHRRRPCRSCSGTTTPRPRPGPRPTPGSSTCGPSATASSSTCGRPPTATSSSEALQRAEHHSSRSTPVPKILFVITAATHWTLADGTRQPAGFWAEEALGPYAGLHGGRIRDRGGDTGRCTAHGRRAQPHRGLQRRPRGRASG